jgi:hypothetical protein
MIMTGKHAVCVSKYMVGREMMDKHLPHRINMFMHSMRRK